MARGFMTPAQERIWLLTEVREQSRLIGNLCCAICKRAIRANENGEVTMADRAEARCGDEDCAAPIYADLSIGIVNYAAFDMLRSVVAIWRAAPWTEGGTILHICADRIETILDLAGHPRTRERVSIPADSDPPCHCPQCERDRARTRVSD